MAIQITSLAMVVTLMSCKEEEAKTAPTKVDSGSPASIAESNSLSPLELTRKTRREEMEIRSELLNWFEKKPPVFFRGKLARKESDGAYVFGQALPTSNYGAAGEAPLGEAVSLFIIGYDGKLAAGTNMGSTMWGHYTYRETKGGKNAFGAPFNVYVYEPIPKVMYQLRDDAEVKSLEYIEARIEHVKTLVQDSSDPATSEQRKIELERAVAALGELSTYRDLGIGDNVLKLAGTGVPLVQIDGIYFFVFEEEGVLIQTDKRVVHSITYLLDPDAIFSYHPSLEEALGNVEPATISVDPGAPFTQEESGLSLLKMGAMYDFMESDTLWEVMELYLSIPPELDAKTFHVSDGQRQFAKRASDNYARYRSRYEGTGYTPSSPESPYYGSGNTPWVGKVDKIWQDSSGLYYLEIILPRETDSALDRISIFTPDACTMLGINPLENDSVMKMKPGDIVTFKCSSEGNNAANCILARISHIHNEAAWEKLSLLKRQSPFRSLGVLLPAPDRSGL